mmetsp:Transcript_25884/g.58013  ORF Transcript_25884/g.58013 Transcript_25884/m.58013 type:complete len:155 (-) Transcript_25884:221-685(-)
MMQVASRQLARPLAKRVLASHAPAFSNRWLATYYAESHEYVKVDGGVGTVGITAHAADALGDIVFVELPEVDSDFNKGETYGSVESVKAASDVYLPVAGEVIEANENLEGNPSLVNESPMDDGWFVKIKISDESELKDLMDDAAYAAFLKTQDK